MASEESWMECVKWLERCQVIAPDHRLARGDIRRMDLVCYLRDGVALCYLLNRLWENAIDLKAFSQRPQNSQYLCKKNIRVFLDTCKSVFGLPDANLFKTQDLIDNEDFDKVIETLSKLSQTEKARKSVQQPFCVSYAISAAVKPNENECSMSSVNDLSPTGSISISSEIYGSIGGDADVYDKLMRDVPGPAIPERPQPKSKKFMCIDELVTTEKKYLDALQMIKKEFLVPTSKILEQREHEKIFYKIEELIEIHKSFYSDLSSAVGTPTEDVFRKEISDCFISWKEKFLIYGEFCSNLTFAQELVDSLYMKSGQIKTTIQNCELAATEGKFRFHDILALPMQRILKYPLFLQQMVKCTEANNPEKKMLERALDEMQDLSLCINEIKRDNEMLSLIEEIDKNIVDLKKPSDTNLKDYGRLQKDGTLKVRVEGANKTVTRYIFLFDKIMLICKLKNDVYFYKDFLLLSHYTLDDSLPLLDIKDRGFGFGFILRKTEGIGPYFAFGPKSREMRAEWIEAIQVTHNNRFPTDAFAHGHHFVMASYLTPTICDVCRKLLRGLFFQGYRCRNTKMSVHKECIKNARNLLGPPTRQLPAKHPHSPSLPSIGIQRNKNSSSSSGDTHQQFEYDDDTDLVLGYGKLCLTKEKCEMGAVQNSSSNKSIHSNADPPWLPCVSRKNATGYMNVQPSDLSAYPWFVGALSRDEATAKIEQRPNGTFLVRISEKGGYALTIMYNDAKHIKIQEKDGRYTLDEEAYFVSISELIDHHQRVSLEATFSEVPIILSRPFKEVQRSQSSVGAGDYKYCRAMHDYSATQMNQLSIRVGDLILIVNKAEETHGWWKGSLNGKVGLFPCAYVTEISK